MFANRTVVNIIDHLSEMGALQVEYSMTMQRRTRCAIFWHSQRLLHNPVVICSFILQLYLTYGRDLTGFSTLVAPDLSNRTYCIFLLNSVWTNQTRSYIP